MRILYIDSFPYWGHGGAQVSLLQLIASLDRSRYHPLFMGARGGSLVERFAAEGVETIEVPRWWISRPPSRSPRKRILHALTARRCITRLLRPRDIDLLHINCEQAASNLGRAASRLGSPYLLHVRDMDRDWFGGRERSAIRKAAAVVVASLAMREYALNAGVPHQKLRVISNGVDPSPFAAARADRSRTRRSLGIADDEFAVGILGSIIPRKGHLDLARAAAAKGMRHSNIRFFVVGRDPHPGAPHMAALRQETRKLRVDSRFRFLGWRDDLPQVLAALDLTVAPFRHEAFGRVVIESFMAATPVIAYRAAALPELIRDGRDGILVAPGNEDAMARAILKLSAAPEQVAEISRCALDRGKDFTIDVHRGRMQALYDDVLP